MRKEIYWDNFVLKTQYQLSVMNGGKEAGGGAVVSSRVHKQQFCEFHESQNKINGVFDLGHMFGWSLCGYKFPRGSSRWV